MEKKHCFKYFTLFLIFLLAFFLRFYRINKVPASLDWDEVAIGWNAHTIFHSRRDEFGTRLPLTFMSFGDYKSPLLIYLTAPFVGIFGLNEFTVRFPSAFFGSLSVLVMYFLVKELLSPPRNDPGSFEFSDPGLGELTALPIIASLLLTISPWHLQFSRPAFEPNLALFFILLGAWLFLKTVNPTPGLYQPVKQPRGWNGPYLFFSSLSFVFALYSYHSPKIFLPFFFLILFALYGKKLLFSNSTSEVRPRKMRGNTTSEVLVWLLVSIALAVILLRPLIKIHLFEHGSARFKGTSIFYTEKGEKRPFDFKLERELIGNYLLHFTPQFLFFGSIDNPRIKMKEMGLLYWIEAPFLLLGLYCLIKQKKKNWAKFLLFWLLIAPVPAMIGRNAPHSVRAFNMLPPLIISIAIGIGRVFNWINKKKKKIKFTVYCLLFTVYCINFIFYFYTYHWKYSVRTAKDWQYGYKELALYLKDKEDEVDQIIVTSAYGQPHIFIQFWQGRDVLDVFWGGMKKYLYRDINWEQDQRMENVLIAGTPEQIPLPAIPRWIKIEKEIYFPDGSVAFRIMKQ